MPVDPVDMGLPATSTILESEEVCMIIEPVFDHKKRYLDLLLLADEQEDMIDRYLERGEMFVLRAEGVARTVCVVTAEGEGIYEIKNLATHPAWQRRGYGRAMIDYVCRRYRGAGRVLLVGTGDSPLTLPFYQRCGFVFSHRLPGFYTEHYRKPIFEGGRQLVDMIYLVKSIGE